MPSARKQINVRVDTVTEELIPALIASVSANIGLAVNQSDLFRLGLHELAKKYPPAVPEAALTRPAPKKRARKR